MTATMTKKVHAPSMFWTMLEGRSMLEFGSFISLRLLMKYLPKGDGHPVIVYPGFLASAASTRPMRGLLRDLGYHVYDWGMGRNLTFNADREAEMHAFVEKIQHRHKQKVSLIGWSLGGVYVREIAKIHPDLVRQVISLGSPITGPRHAARARPVFEALNGKPTPETRERLRHLHEVPPVPSTSIYTKTDGIVHWEGSVQDDAPEAENIQVPASHLGLGVNPLVMFILANRLAQNEGSWAPFEMSGLKSLVFKAPKKSKS